MKLKDIVKQVALNALSPGTLVICMSHIWDKDHYYDRRIKFGEILTVVEGPSKNWTYFKGKKIGYNPIYFKKVD